jgi:hypothetical protein
MSLKKKLSTGVVAPPRTPARRATLNDPRGARTLLGSQPQQAPSIPEVPPLLHTRQQASRLLNCSVATLQRLEKSGALTPVKLNKRSPSAQTFYKRSDLLALVGGEMS